MINGIVNYVDDTLTALADPTRRRVVELLRQGPRRAGDIAAEVGMSRQAMSRHLNVLRARGIVDVELVDADGRGRTYRLRSDRLVALSAWLDQVQAGHAEQLAAFRRYAEERAAIGGPGGGLAPAGDVAPGDLSATGGGAGRTSPPDDRGAGGPSAPDDGGAGGPSAPDDGGAGGPSAPDDGGAGGPSAPDDGGAGA